MMKKIATYVVLALASLLTLAPVIWTVLSSMRPPAESLSTDGSLIPSSLDLSSYPAVFEEVDMWLLILNLLPTTLGTYFQRIMLMSSTTGALGGETDAWLASWTILSPILGLALEKGLGYFF